MATSGDDDGDTPSFRETERVEHDTAEVVQLNRQLTSAVPTKGAATNTASAPPPSVTAVAPVADDGGAPNHILVPPSPALAGATAASKTSPRGIGQRGPDRKPRKRRRCTPEECEQIKAKAAATKEMNRPVQGGEGEAASAKKKKDGRASFSKKSPQAEKAATTTQPALLLPWPPPGGPADVDALNKLVAPDPSPGTGIDGAMDSNQGRGKRGPDKSPRKRRWRRKPEEERDRVAEKAAATKEKNRRQREEGEATGRASLSSKKKKSAKSGKMKKADTAATAAATTPVYYVPAVVPPGGCPVAPAVASGVPWWHTQAMMAPIPAVPPGITATTYASLRAIPKAATAKKKPASSVAWHDHSTLSPAEKRRRKEVHEAALAAAHALPAPDPSPQPKQRKKGAGSNLRALIGRKLPRPVPYEDTATTDHSALGAAEKRRRKKRHEAAVAAVAAAYAVPAPASPPPKVKSAGLKVSRSQKQTAAPPRGAQEDGATTATGRSTLTTAEKIANARAKAGYSPPRPPQERHEDAAVVATPAARAPELTSPPLPVDEAERRSAAASATLRAAEEATEKAAAALREAETALTEARENQKEAEALTRARARQKERERELKYGRGERRDLVPLRPSARFRKGARAGIMNTVWVRNYELLHDHIEETGSCEIIGRAKRGDGTELGRLYDWVIHQRKCYWVCMNAGEPASKSGRKKDGSTDADGKSAADEEEKRAQKVKEATKYMTPAKIALLEALPGWQWSKKNPNAWEDKFNALVRYKAHHNTLVVTKNSPDAPPGLVNWVASQRNAYHRMQRGEKKHITLERVHLLESIGFVWDISADRWNKWFDALLDYKREYGTCQVPKRYKKSGVALGSWCLSIRRYYRDIQEGKTDPTTSALTPERIALLEQAGFPWTAESARFKSKDAVTGESQIPGVDSDTESDDDDAGLQYC